MANIIVNCITSFYNENNVLVTSFRKSKFKNLSFIKLFKNMVYN
jgi:hypothetical protein